MAKIDKNAFSGLEVEVGYARQSIDMQAGIPLIILIAAIWSFAHS